MKSGSLNILDLFEQSNDAHLGQTLVRLARLAESIHRVEAAGASQKDQSDGQSREEKNGVEGLTPRPVVVVARPVVPNGSALHPEARREVG